MPKFDDTVKSRLDELVSRYPNRKGALLPALWVAQDVYGGWLPEEAMQEVADHLKVSRAEVEGVVTFYTMFHREPIGRHHIEICNNISCLLLGAESLIHHSEERLGVSRGETTADGRFTLSCAECLGACSNAPAMMVGSTYYENVTPEKFDRVVESLQNSAVSEVEHPPQARMPEQTAF
jgi:NADH-quinone oxidoreductase subunit E